MSEICSSCELACRTIRHCAVKRARLTALKKFQRLFPFGTRRGCVEEKDFRQSYQNYRAAFKFGVCTLHLGICRCLSGERTGYPILKSEWNDSRAERDRTCTATVIVIRRMFERSFEPLLLDI